MIELFLPGEVRRSWVSYVLSLGYDIDPYRQPDALLKDHKVHEVLLRLLQEASSHSSERLRAPATALYQELIAQREQRGLPTFTVDNLPTGRLANTETPTDPDEFGKAGKEDLLAEVTLLAINAAMGFQPKRDLGISDGAAIQHIVPRQGLSSTVGNAGTEPFGPHTEGAFQQPEEVPHGLTLLGLRNPTETATCVYVLDELLTKLTPDEATLLRTGTFTCRSGFATSDVREFTGVALYTDEAGRNVWRVRAVKDTWDSPNLPEQRLIEKLFQLLSNPDPCLCYECVISPGRFLFVDNHRCAHGRSAILDQQGKPLQVNSTGHHRWLLREQVFRDPSL